MSKITRGFKGFIQFLKGYDIEALKKSIKFWLLFFGVIFFIILLATGTIKILFFAGSQESSILYTLLNALVFGVYINALGIFNKGTKKLKYKLIILSVAILIMITGFGYFDFQIHFNLWFFAYRIYSSSSVHGILFFWINLYFWSAIYFLSYMTESEESSEG